MQYSDEDIAYYLADGDLTKYDVILSDLVSRVFRIYYQTKLKDVNELISHYNSITELEKLKNKNTKR